MIMSNAHNNYHNLRPNLYCYFIQCISRPFGNLELLHLKIWHICIVLIIIMNNENFIEICFLPKYIYNCKSHDWLGNLQLAIHESQITTFVLFTNHTRI